MGKMIDIVARDGDGSFKAYVTETAGKSKGAIVVIQEIFGVNVGIRAKVDNWANQGYSAYAPDLFWREKPGIELDADVPEDFQAALGYMQKTNLDKAIEDIEATIRTARTQSGGKVGVVGYCFGGLLTYLSSTRTDTDASVGYYGGGIDNFLGEAHAISRPLMLHFAENDHFISAEAIAKIKDVLESSARVEIHTYPDVDHGFAAEFGARRQEAEAQLADSRTSAFFAKHLA